MNYHLINVVNQSFTMVIKCTMYVTVLCAFLFLGCSQEPLETNEEESIEKEIASSKNVNSLSARVVKITPNSVSANGDDGNRPANTLDGNLGTRWSSKGYNGKYITYDLGSVKSISSIKLAWYKGDRRKAYFKIRVGTSTSNLRTVVDRKRSGSSGNTLQLETYDFNAVNARYVRISCFGNSSSAWNSLTEAEIYGDDGSGDGDGDGGNGGSGGSPGNVLGLTSNTWKLNGFTGNPGSSATYRDDVLRSTGKTFDNYADPNYFYTDGEWTYFKCYRGLGGSANSGNPRVELRELINGNLASWNGSSGNNTMTFTVRVDQLPRDRDNNGGVLCFAQIHGPSSTVDDVIRVQFIGDEDQSSGGVRMKISGYITEEVQGGSKIIDRGYRLDTSYTFKLTYNNGTVKLFQGSTQIFSQDMDTSTSGNYFKVGNYLQSVQGASYTGSYGLVRIKNLRITH